MTVIAYDGYTLAADSGMVNDTSIISVQKIHRLDNGVSFGCAGSAALCAWVKELFFRGGINERCELDDEARNTWAHIQEKYISNGSSLSCMIISPDGKVFDLDTTPYPIEITDCCYAIGCGTDFVLGAMRAGASAPQAVKLATKYADGCYGEVITMSVRSTWMDE